MPEGLVANPLPQALILTAIVIGFSLLAFALVLSYRALHHDAHRRRRRDAPGRAAVSGPGRPQRRAGRQTERAARATGGGGMTAWLLFWPVMIAM